MTEHPRKTAQERLDLFDNLHPYEMFKQEYLRRALRALEGYTRMPWPESTAKPLDLSDILKPLQAELARLDRGVAVRNVLARSAYLEGLGLPPEE